MQCFNIVPSRKISVIDSGTVMQYCPSSYPYFFFNSPDFSSFTVFLYFQFRRGPRRLSDQLLQS